MKIGLLAYHSAANFGARLQLLSTYMFLKGRDYQPVIINWVPEDLERFYSHMASTAQKECLDTFSHQVWTETDKCRTSEDVAKVIEKEGIDAVIIGSDAVAKINFPQIVFPCKRIITYSRPSQDRVYPNPFWGEFLKYTTKVIPVAVMSASCESSPYEKIKKGQREEMDRAVKEYKYLSVRDTWTQNMFHYITGGRVAPPITPDPVFAFNHNATSIIPTKEELKKRFSLPDKYILLSFIRKSVEQKWITEFERVAEGKGYTCISLPISYSNSVYDTKRSIGLPLSPIDWYSLIAYSDGYVGHNMHPVVIALTNGVPVFSFDNYGKTHFWGLKGDGSSSKVLHILKKAGLEDCRVSCVGRRCDAPEPEVVLEKLLSFDKEKTKTFAQGYYEEYQKMMNDILKAIQQ